MTHKELANLIKGEIEQDDPSNYLYTYGIKDKKFLMTQPKLAKHFKVSINKISRAIDLLKEGVIVNCNKKAGCEIKTYDKPFVYIEDQVISNLVKSSEYLNINFKDSETKYFFKGQEITDPMQLKNPNSIDIYTYDELYEKYDKLFIKKNYVRLFYKKIMFNLVRRHSYFITKKDFKNLKDKNEK